LVSGLFAATPPHPPKESTYTITSVLQLARPFNLADMNDDYQDARVVSQDQDSITVEIVYYPLTTIQGAIGENPDWKRDYAGMTEYLRPTPDENWDQKMRADLLAELRKDGIDADRLTDKQLVAQVSHWALERSHHGGNFIIWSVEYPRGVPEVFPPLRSYFNSQKPERSWTDQAMFEQEALGRSMFYKRVHGDCTSSAVYLATILRALGIPTRIVVCVPPADFNDRRQVELLFSAIHHHQVLATIKAGLPHVSGSFANHLFNEVFIGNRWVRLNYDTLGQKILDEHYLGLMTHILTTPSLSEVPLAETWGVRYAKYPDVAPRLSSINPYRLLRISDHFGIHARIPNPAADLPDLRTAHVVEALWQDALPHWARGDAVHTRSDFYLGIGEYIKSYWQESDFLEHAGKRVILAAPGRPDIGATFTNHRVSWGAENQEHHQLFGFHIDPKDHERMVRGAAYQIRPVNTNDMYAWKIQDSVALKIGAIPPPPQTPSRLFFLSGAGMMIVGLAPVVWCGRRRAARFAIGAGAAAWTVAVALKFAWAVPLNDPIRHKLESLLPQALAHPAFYLYVGLLTGVFECTIPWLLVRRSRLKTADWSQAVAFGIGFGAIEAFLLGLVSCLPLLAVIFFRDLIPADALEKILNLYRTDLRGIPLPVIERITALIVHTFATVLIVYGVRARQVRWFWISFAYKTAVDAFALALLAWGMGNSISKMAQFEAWFALFAVIGIAGLRALKPRYGYLAAPPSLTSAASSSY